MSLLSIAPLDERTAASSTPEPLQQPSHLSMSAWPDITVVLGKRMGHTGVIAYRGGKLCC